MSSNYILGISCFYHDAAACLLRDGQVMGAAQEERFTRIRHDQNFPAHSIRYCMEEAGIEVSDLKAVVFYDKPFLTFERLLETYLYFAPKGFRSFITSMPVWLKSKLSMRKSLENEFKQHFNSKPNKILFSEHHESHAASAFFPSPFNEAAILCMDGVGEWATTSAWVGKNNELTPLWEIRFPHSLGLLYSAFTYHAGFKVNSGEYKVMGLAPYGKPVYVQKILDHLIDLKDDGSFKLNQEYFNYAVGLTMTNEKFSELFDGPPRQSESKLTQREMDLARSVQDVTEEIVLRLARTVHKQTGIDSLCLAGGVALNCVANGRLLREGPFKKVWIQPAAGDAGGALGAALTTWHQYFENPMKVKSGDLMNGSYLGPSASMSNIEEFLKMIKVPFRKLEDDELFAQVATDLAQEKVVGWFSGRMEYGPRALGGRSILGDPRSKKMQSIMNLKIKYRESFRPFAPSVLHEDVGEYFDLNQDSPYMLLVASVKNNLRISLTPEQQSLWGIDLLNIPRSTLPAITHVDYSARIQTVHPETNPRYYSLIKKFKELTGCGVVVNTSFNVRGEPIVCTPQDAYRCFMRTEIDTLVLENFVLDKVAQPKKELNQEWMKQFELD